MEAKMQLSPVKAIRAKCLDCAGGMKEVRLCSTESCPLHPFRFGRNPARAGVGGRPDLVSKKIVT
jgi:hypothetical protein